MGAKVETVSNVRKEVVWITGGTGRHRRPVLRHVVMDVLWKDATLLKENPWSEGTVIVSDHLKQNQIKVLNTEYIPYPLKMYILKKICSA